MAEKLVYRDRWLHYWFVHVALCERYLVGTLGALPGFIGFYRCGIACHDTGYERVISHLVLRLGFWLLLTADASLINIIIGVLVALALPFPKGPRLPLFAWIQGVWKTIKLLPIAYLEALSLLLHAHTKEVVTTRAIPVGQNPWLLLLEIFLINFSPKSIVIKKDEQGRLHIHHIRQRKCS